MIGWLKKLLGQDAQTIAERPHLRFETFPEIVYAIGDVHGCFELLLELEAKIALDCEQASTPAQIVMLGDYVDRGPQSAQIIEHLLDSPSFNARRICLAGNHEEIMLQFIEQPRMRSAWLGFGGSNTLASYGLDLGLLTKPTIRDRPFSHKVKSIIPDDHVTFLRTLPSIAEYPHHIFAHAGVRPNVSMALQTDRDLMWIRDDFLSHSERQDYLVIHGHSPCKTPFKSDLRINVDTMAYSTGMLSAVKFVHGNFSKFLST